MNQARRDLLKAMGTIAASPAAVPEPARKGPNILVFLTDDHAQWLQQAYGNSEVQTPNLNRIAQNGVLMNSAFTTTPVCSPARASFFTGLMPSQHGIHDWIEEKTQAYAYPWLQGQTLISELLQKQGYHTGLVGKWHCGGERIPHPGFDFWFSYWESQYPHNGEQHFSDNGRQRVENGFQSPMLTEQALRFLRDHYDGAAKKDQPFFLFVGYTDTHSPHSEMPADLAARYSSAGFRDIPAEPFSAAHGRPLIPVSKNPDDERRKREQYYAAASSVDREVGRVLDELAARGELDNTLVVYTGDHGLNAGQHGMWEKGNATVPQNFLEESIRIPCALSWPAGGIARHLESDLLVNHCDLFATLLEAAGAPSPGYKGPGQSYLSNLRGRGEANWKEQIICEYGNARMIRARGYKLILRYPYQGVTFPNELYDLKADPRETVNLYSKSPLTEQMADSLNEFFARYSDPRHSGLHLENQPLATKASPWLTPK